MVRPPPVGNRGGGGGGSDPPEALASDARLRRTIQSQRLPWRPGLWFREGASSASDRSRVLFEDKAPKKIYETLDCRALGSEIRTFSLPRTLGILMLLSCYCLASQCYSCWLQVSLSETREEYRVCRRSYTPKEHEQTSCLWCYGAVETGFEFRL